MVILIPIICIQHACRVLYNTVMPIAGIRNNGTWMILVRLFYGNTGIKFLCQEKIRFSYRQ